jgi:hypothetical protein
MHSYIRVPGLKIFVPTAMVILPLILLMNIVTNYSLEFGVMLRAVCPTRAGLPG